MLVGLLKPTAGKCVFMGKDIFNVSKDEIRKFRPDLQMIFQDPFESLNPRKTVHHILSQPYVLQKILEKDKIEEKVHKLMETVGLNPPSHFIDRYPHELSGGQKQRVGVARAIALHPKLIVADEPVSALDMSVRAQILNLLKHLREDLGLTYLYITHDLSVVRSLSDRVAVMYLGKIVEHADVYSVFENPLHPYTAGLLSATPIPDPRTSRTRRRIILSGDVPSPLNPPLGCRFETRCPNKRPECLRLEPELVQAESGHFVACHLAQR
jgi:oligopeptide/dipeptide ABC transporter ATP-binding protein